MAATTLGAARRAANRPLGSSVGEREYGTRPLYTPPDPSAQGTVGASYMPEMLQDAFSASLTDTNALLQQILEQTRYIATFLQSTARMGAGAGPVPAALGGPGMFAPTAAAYQDPVVQATARQIAKTAAPAGQAALPAGPVARPPTTAPDKVGEADERQQQKRPFETAAPSEGRTKTTGEIYQERTRGPGGPAFLQPFQSNLGPGYGLRQRVAESMMKHIQNQPNWGPSLEQDPATGQFYRAGTGQMEAAGQMSGQGSLFGGATAPEAATASEVSRFKTMQTIKGGAETFLGELSGGQTAGAAAQEALGGMGLGAGAAVLGVGAAAYGGAVVAKNFANQQRAQNAQWQRILGGTNAEGFGERAQEYGFATTQNWFGGMGNAQARQLYEGAASIYGRDRGARNTAQDFGVQMWRQLGVDVSESLQLVETAAKAGNDSLTGLADSLTNVTKTARDAGVNAETARQGFETLYQGATQMTTGPAVAGTQGLLATAETSLGRQFPGVTLNTLNTPGVMQQMAAQQGVAYPAFTARIGTDPVFAAGAYEDQIKRTTGELLSQFPQATQIINEATANGTKNLSSGQWQDLARRLQTEGNINPDMVAQALNARVGTNLTPANAVEFLAKAQATAGFDLKGEAERAQGATKETTLTPEARKQLQTATTTQDRGVAKGITDRADPAVQDMLRMVSGGTRDPVTGKVTGGSLSAKPGGERGMYLNQVSQTGVRNPVIEAMVASTKFNKDVRFRVETKEGPRFVTEDQLIQDYAGQAATAEIVKGPGDMQGQTVAKALGMSLDPSVEAASQADAANSPAKRGDTTAPDTSGAEGGAAGATVQVVPTPLLTRYLSFLDSNGNPVDTSRSTGGAANLPPSYGGAKTGNP